MNVVSIDGHPRPEDLSAYVDNTLEAHAAEQLEDHVVKCSVCAARLQHAAEFQMLLHEAAATMAPAGGGLARHRASRRWRVGAVGGLWAAAAAVVLMVCSQGSDIRTEPPETRFGAGRLATAEGSVSASNLMSDEPSGALLASVDPLQSIDPLQTWPDETLPDSGWSDDEPVDGEPCGSGEDGGPLVCQPFAG